VANGRDEKEQEMLQNKFTKKPIMVNGVKADDVSYYFSKPKTITNRS
jgi:hypothetical protein